MADEMTDEEIIRATVQDIFEEAINDAGYELNHIDGEEDPIGAALKIMREVLEEKEREHASGG